MSKPDCQFCDAVEVENRRLLADLVTVKVDRDAWKKSYFDTCTALETHGPNILIRQQHDRIRALEADLADWQRMRNEAMAVAMSNRARIIELESALRDIASYEGADSSLDINAANMRATASEAFGLESEGGTKS